MVSYSNDAPADRLSQVARTRARRAFDYPTRRHITMDIPADQLAGISTAFSHLPWVTNVVVFPPSNTYLASTLRRHHSSTFTPPPNAARWSETTPWGIHFTNADLVQSTFGNYGSGVKVAVMDGGLNCSDGDLTGHVAGGVDFVGDGYTYCQDPISHGTEVAGIVGAASNGDGVLGMAPSASLYSIRVADTLRRVSYATVEAGLVWAINNNMQVVNMSFADCGGSFSDSVSTDLTAAINAHLILVAAAGNGDSTVLCTSSSPVSNYASHSGVIAVAAFESSDTTVPSWQQHGTEIFIAAPHRVATIGNSSFSGTSAAAPHVSGAVALMLAQGFSYAEVPTFLAYETQNKPSGSGHPRNTTRGYGFLDAGASVQITPQIASFVTDCNGVVYTGDVCHVSAHRLSTTGYAPFGYHWSIAATGGWTVTTYSSSDSTLTFTVPGDYMSSFTIEVRDSLSDAVTANHARLGLAQEIDWVVCPGGEALRASTTIAAAPVASPSTIVRQVFGVTGSKATRPLFLGSGGGHTDSICP